MIVSLLITKHHPATECFSSFGAIDGWNSNLVEDKSKEGYLLFQAEEIEGDPDTPPLFRIELNFEAENELDVVTLKES